MARTPKKTAGKKTAPAGRKKSAGKKAVPASRKKPAGKRAAGPGKKGKTALGKAAGEVAARLAGAGYEAVFAGGCVRDMVMGLEPKDYDIATDATPQIVQELFAKTYAVGAQFGVVVVLHGGHQFEVATFRVDSAYSDGRHPDAVRFGDAKADVMRRDFTVNGMLYDPKKNEVIDYVGGRKDLKDGIIRCIGEPSERFAEDRLRMLRAVRFASRLGFEIEPATREAIARHAPQVVAVSQERIKAEIEQILAHESAVEGITELHALGLLAHALPEADRMASVRLPQGTLLEHALAVLKGLSQPPFELALAALLHCSGGADEKGCLEESTRLASVAARRLKCSNTERSRTVWLVQNQSALENTTERKLSYLKRLFVHECFGGLLNLLEAKTRGGCAEKRDFDYASRLHSKLGMDEVAPEPLLTGTDLIEMGLKPSELFSVILDMVYDTQLDGEITQRQEAIDLALKVARES